MDKESNYLENPGKSQKPPAAFDPEKKVELMKCSELETVDLKSTVALRKKENNCERLVLITGKITCPCLR